VEWRQGTRDGVASPRSPGVFTESVGHQYKALQVKSPSGLLTPSQMSPPVFLAYVGAVVDPVRRAAKRARLWREELIQGSPAPSRPWGRGRTSGFLFSSCSVSNAFGARPIAGSSISFPGRAMPECRSAIPQGSSHPRHSTTQVRMRPKHQGMPSTTDISTAFPPAAGHSTNAQCQQGRAR